MTKEKLKIIRYKNAFSIKKGGEKTTVVVNDDIFSIELISKGQPDVPRATHLNMRNKFAYTTIALRMEKAEALFVALGQMLEKYKV